MTADDIATTLVAKLMTIRTANGYATECGSQVFQGRRAISVEQTPCVVIHEGDEKIDDGTRRTFKNATDYVLEGFATCDADNPNVAARAIVKDIKRAVFTGDITFGSGVVRLEYLGRFIGENPAGTNYVSARVGIRVTYADHMLP